MARLVLHLENRLRVTLTTKVIKRLQPQGKESEVGTKHHHTRFIRDLPAKRYPNTGIPFQTKLRKNKNQKKISPN